MREQDMRKTTLHVWITLFFCALAMAAEAVHGGSIPLPF
jgi:hypothetical protein